MADLLLIDLPNLLMRNWHGAGLKTDADAEALARNTKGTLQRLLELEKPRHVVACEDRPNCWRLHYHPGYKHGAGSADDRTVSPHHLVQLLEPWMDAWGLCRASAPQMEADDVIATLVHQADQQAGMTVTVYTRDSDQVQLVSARTTVRWPGQKGESDVLMTPEKVLELYGVHPHQYADLKVLLAYPKDNLRGALGLPPGTRCAFSQKRAVELLGLYGTFVDLLDHRTALTDKESAWLRDHEEGLSKMHAIAHLATNAKVTRTGPSGVGHLKLS